MRCVILGQGKSGTTALYYAVREHLRDGAGVFEPRDLRDLDLSGQTVVVKKMIGMFEPEEVECLARFDRRVFLVRDPRDALVSRLVYSAWDPAFVVQEAKVTAFLEGLKAKERDPRAVPVVALYDLARELELLGGNAVEQVERLNPKTIGLWEQLRDSFYLVRYEEFVAGRLGGLRRYLGLDVRHDVDVPAGHSRVSRTRTSGDWRNWFTAADVEYFRPRLEPFMSAFGYAQDWSLPATPTINPDHASRYVERLVLRLRQELQPGAVRT